MRGRTPSISWSSEYRGGSGAPSRTWSHGRGVRADPLAPRARPQRLRVGGLLAPVVGALRMQALGAPSEAVAVDRDAGAATPAYSISGTVSRSRSRSRATTIRPPSSRSRAPRPESAGFCATSWRWARDRLRFSTACASPSPTGTSRVRSEDRSLRALRRRAEVGGEAVFDEGRDNCLVQDAASACFPSSGAHAGRRQRPRGTSLSLTARRPVGTGSAARCPREPARWDPAAEKRPASDRRSLHREETDRVVGRARLLRLGVAAGLWRGGHRLVAVRDGN